MISVCLLCKHPPRTAGYPVPDLLEGSLWEAARHRSRRFKCPGRHARWGESRVHWGHRAGISALAWHRNLDPSPDWLKGRVAAKDIPGRGNSIFKDKGDLRFC